jgi:hypothetical protein
MKISSQMSGEAESACFERRAFSPGNAEPHYELEEDMVRDATLPVGHVDWHLGLCCVGDWEAKAAQNQPTERPQIA